MRYPHSFPLNDDDCNDDDDDDDDDHDYHYLGEMSALMPTTFALQSREIFEDDFADPAVESVSQAEIVGGGGQVLSRATTVWQLQVCVVPLASLHVT